MAHIKPKSPVARITQPVSPYRRPKEIAPEPYDTQKPFASEIKNNVGFGSKYEFKPNSNPAPGTYRTEDADKHLSTTARSPGATIRKETSPYRRPKEPIPDAYTGHLTAFGSEAKGINFGSKYEFKPNSNPPPGYYRTEEADKHLSTSTRSPGATIREPTSPYRRPVEPTPDSYTGHLTAFGSEGKNVNFGSKYKFKPNSNPGPGDYRTDDADKNLSTRKKSPGATIREETSPYRRPVEPTPDSYTGHLTAFGSDAKGIDFGSKYKFKPDQNPPPGYYRSEEADKHLSTSTRSPGATIRKETSPYRRPKEPIPDAYTGHLTAFGSEAKGINFGSKYEFKPDSNPPPGYY